MNASSDNKLNIAGPASMEPASKEINITHRVFHLLERVMDGELRRDEQRAELIKQMKEQTTASSALGNFLQSFGLRLQAEPAA